MAPTFFGYHPKKVGKETCLPVYLPKVWQAGVTAAPFDKLREQQGTVVELVETTNKNHVRVTLY